MRRQPKLAKRTFPMIGKAVAGGGGEDLGLESGFLNKGRCWIWIDEWQGEK